MPNGLRINDKEKIPIDLALSDCKMRSSRGILGKLSKFN